MLPEVEVYAHQLEWILERCSELIAPLNQEQLHWRPEAADTNSAAAIGAHVAGATAAYALGMGAGVDVGRDRLAEFAPGDVTADEVVARLKDMAQAIRDAFDGLSAGDLEEVIVPSKELWGTGEPQPTLRRTAIVEAIRHAGIHLGELRLTVSLG